MRHCKCGNTLSLQRQEDGIDNCPACDPSQDQIDGKEYNQTQNELIEANNRSRAWYYTL